MFARQRTLGVARYSSE